MEQSLATARRSGTAVEVGGAATPTDTVTANPDGTLTLSRTVVPTRKLVGGAWVGLDASLRRNGDGTLSTTATTGGLTLSGGGSGPLATMSGAGRSVAFSLPFALPAPTVSGDTATYAGVLPGVDLKVVAGLQGGFSHVLVVRDAAAAANPALRRLTLATKADGVALTADGHGNITGRDRAGEVVLTAPAPMAWDSARGLGAEARAASPGHGTSTVRGPGEAAKTAPIGVAVTPGGIELAPGADLLTGADTVYPVYIDPTFTWSSLGTGNNGWASISQHFQSTNYWKNTPDPDGRMQVGNSGSMWSHTLINFPIDTATLAGAAINSATIDITETWSYSCTPSRVNLYAPATTLTSSNATWNAWEGVNLGGVADYKNVAYGYNSSCPAHGVAFNVLDEVRADVGAGKKTQTFVLTGQNEGGDTNSWKEFLQTSPRLTITYNHRPNTPDGMTTSPATSCAAATPTTLGAGTVSLYAPVSDRDGGNLGVSFKLWKTGDATQTAVASSDPNLLTYRSGTTAVLVVPAAVLTGAAGGTLTGFSWKVQVTDFNMSGDWSATCRFDYDPAYPGAPGVTPPAEQTVIGRAAAFTIAAPVGGPTPVAYNYQLNGAAPATVNASAGGAQITVAPTRYTNTLTVTSLSAGGNFGDTARVVFNSDPAAAAADADLTGDGVADLLAAGGANGLPSGLWLSAGRAFADVNTNATDIGANGNGIGAGSPADFDGGQVVSGRFTGNGLQDVLVYYPSGSNAGGGSILHANGDGSVIQAQLTENQYTLGSDLLVDDLGNRPSQVANAGNTTGRGLLYPDLMGVAGDADDGYYLTYYPNLDLVGGYSAADRLSTPTPAGDMAWNQWTIATAQVAGATAMFLWNRGTGALHLWTDLRYDMDGTLSHTGRTLSGDWNAGTPVSLRAADIDADGTADLWAVGAGGTATAWLVTGLTGGTGTVTARPPRSLVTSAHTWPLNDGTGGARATNAADTTGTATLRASGNAVWHDGDLFSPSLLLNTDAAGTAVDPTGTGHLAGNGPLVDTTRSFSVSVWVKPTRAGGVIVSEDGAHSSRFIMWHEESDDTWRFGMAGGDITGWSYDQVISPAGARLGVWTHLVATYDADVSTMALYVNGLLTGTARHDRAVTWPATGDFVIGRYLNNGAPTAYYSGQVGNVRTWGTALTATQVGAANTTHARSGHWKFDTATGATSDGSGNGRPLTFNGAATTGTGKLGQGLVLNGTTGYASTGNVVNVAGGYTVCAWAKLDAVANLTYRAVFSQDASRSSGFWLRTNAQGHWEFVIGITDSQYTTVAAPALATAGTWTHLCGAWDAATSQMMLFVDGALAGAKTATGISAPGAFTIGRYKYLDGYAGAFAGVIDDVRTYVGGISDADQIRTIMDGRVGAEETDHARAGHWRFDTGTGILTDGSGNNRTLTLNGAATVGSDGRPVQGLVLNGTTGYASTGNVVNVAGGYTVCAWAKLDAVANLTYRAVFSQDASRSSGFWLRTNAQGHWEFVIGITDSQYT
ncbi:LamG-like jellyroll fold domain-containing protein, partial [Sphaerisporangium corydalis]|uniref:LamG-like jellyroll fold domain-containing protein n=1 Tax=Sphaerisporangium corydalis TaxID=1441875 RepID=UPI0021CF02D3